MVILLQIGLISTYYYNEKPNHIRFDWEKHMKYTMIDLDEENEPVTFVKNILGKYSS